MKTIEKIEFGQLAAQFGTPLYVYSENELTQAYARYQTAFAALNPLICYAVKANSNLSIIQHFARLGSGFDTVSGGEIARVLAAGGSANKIIFSGVGKSEVEIEFALNAGIKCFNVESLPELDRINAVAQRLGKTAPVSLRINPDVDAKTHPYISTGLKANKFGIAMADAEQAYRHAGSLHHLRIVGIDCHIGSQLMDWSPLTEACERLLQLTDRLAAQGIVLEHIDLGGGIGIAYQNEQSPDLDAYAAAVQTYQAYHHIENAETSERQAVFLADIVGPICETSDFLARDRMISAQAGDLLLVRSAGAYASSMASNYNTRGRAAEVLVSGDKVRLIRPRETWEDVFASEKSVLA